ncbi:GGDEF domain-containing protein [Shewanella xiamenensis]|uniref:GGDEF domain-containing protein n=2 Tax=Shewanella xiamenensis TaxID=332186 RepID=UPI000849993D|nr:GGDEF domain-containing protein [Shewanella xiamenensis]MCT8865630.1 GGDEF domain-containing protein [Shewanella xiamenensis]MCT8869683.1 GGDEF domain-containing protein [Shewanella xiamenensis]MCT8878515.1 GGDEF domain-containing protein [Shewanella xiamenensis]ODR87530.1 diguanylate cyclase [Shewanella xiamenensis]TVL27509.1 diguanylate cyclase [Shewanella xiamenensis]
MMVSKLSWSLVRQSCSLATLIFVVLLLVLLPLRIEKEHRAFVKFVRAKHVVPSYLELLGKSLSLHDIIDFDSALLTPFKLDSSRLLLPSGGALSPEEELILRYFDYLYSNNKNPVRSAFIYIGLYKSNALYFASTIPDEVKSRLIHENSFTNEFCQRLHYCSKDASADSLVDDIVLSVPYRDEVTGNIILSMAAPISSSHAPEHLWGDVIADTSFMATDFMQRKVFETQNSPYGTETVISGDSFWTRITPNFLFYAMSNHLDNQSVLTYKISTLRFFMQYLPLWLLLSGLTIIFQLKFMRLKQLRTERQQFSEAMLLDPFTKTYNKKIYETLIFKAATASQYAVICIDGDKIKTINDTHGHQLGDLAIMQIVEAMRAVFRENDIIIRTGGDEFVVILANCPIDKAQQLADRLKDNIRQRHFLNMLTVSCGVADSMDCLSFEAVFLAADKALYADKTQKRSDDENDVLR